ncbi:hypothetical protein M407DRAFT_28737 [Tulasnella calospora MUT 4182]|uniref:Uncharacterized protein n=1 Tax=Tulasnella calospora MUT 4182 TaxID=1051891 RepID=A0A0C3Q0U7_9AGAM|nr:hypothetical protein M407DRAFT_28737 [Tulasnella calospora MUT 4182]
MDTIPTEILIHILNFSIPSKRQRRVRKSLSRVCHFWRTAIYGSPLFWTEVRLHRTNEELQETLRRNSNGPLDVIWAPSNPGKFMDYAGMQRLAIISSQSQRWRSLVLAGPITHEIETQLMAVPTPRLVNLNIVGSFFGAPELGLSGAGASLRELTLGSAALDWGNPRLTGLRCLRLHTPRHKTPTVEQLHTILSSSPSLEILDLACWTSLSHSEPKRKELGPVLLPSLTTLAVEGVPSTVLGMLVTCIQAPNCRYIRLPSISHTLFRDNHPLKELVKLCQGPLSTVPRVLVSYNRGSGSCIITHRGTDLPPQPNIRESLVKLAKRRGVYFQTEGIFIPILEGDALRSSEGRVRSFIQEFVQPALRDLSVEIQLDLHHKWPRLTDTPSNPPKSVVTDLLLSVPLVTHLRIRSYFDPMDVLPFISTSQAVRTMDGEGGPESSWPIPLMQTLTVACNSENQSAVLESLESLISKRGPHIHHETPTPSGQADDRRDGVSHPLRPLKHIIVEDENELPFKVWDTRQGWRAC